MLAYSANLSTHPTPKDHDKYSDHRSHQKKHQTLPNTSQTSNPISMLPTFPSPIIPMQTPSHHYNSLSPQAGEGCHAFSMSRVPRPGQLAVCSVTLGNLEFFVLGGESHHAFSQRVGNVEHVERLATSCVVPCIADATFILVGVARACEKRDRAGCTDA